MTRATVLGTGSWGTAFAATMADAGTEVTMWARRREVVEQINRGTNEDYLADAYVANRDDVAPSVGNPATADGAAVVAALRSAYP